MNKMRRRAGMTRLLAVLAILFGSVTLPASAVSAEENRTPIAVDSVDHPIPNGVRDSVVRLYRAVFERAPDNDGLEHWVGRYQQGMLLSSIADSFITSPEWTATYGNLDDDAFVDVLYQNVLGRLPDGDGSAYWRVQLADGLSRAEMLLGFSESAEYVEATGTSAPVVPVVFPALPPNAGSGRRIVYSNSEQRVWWVEANERVVQSYPVSGRRGVPNPGTYAVYSKSPRAWAGHDGITMQHMVRFAHGSKLAIGFHSIPRYADGSPLQTEDELGGYRSAGCVRQADHQAEALYRWAPIGTTVVVLA